MQQGSAVSLDAPDRPAPRPPPTGRLRVPSLVRCGLTILAVKAGLKTAGFARTLTWIGHRACRVQARCHPSAGDLRATERAVAMAGALYPGRALCLEQSLALYYLLRRRGVPVRYCQGVQPYPFEAHAWVEYGGTPINDVIEHVTLFARFPDQLP
jgi:hypothetical protein